MPRRAKATDQISVPRQKKLKRVDSRRGSLKKDEKEETNNTPIKTSDNLETEKQQDRRTRCRVNQRTRTSTTSGESLTDTFSKNGTQAESIKTNSTGHNAKAAGRKVDNLDKKGSVAGGKRKSQNSDKKKNKDELPVDDKGIDHDTVEPETKKVKKGRRNEPKLVSKDIGEKRNFSGKKASVRGKASKEKAGRQGDASPEQIQQVAVTEDENPGTYCTEVQYLKHQIKEQNSTGCPNLSHQHSENSEEHSENLSNFAAVNLASAIKAKKPKTPVKKRSDGSNTDLGDIKRLLLQFEGGEGVHDAGNNTMETSEDDDSDWEEVEDVGGSIITDLKSQVPEQSVEVTLEASTFNKRKKKNKFDPKEWFRLQMNRYKRETQLCVHKVHLLCLLSHGFHRNHLCNGPLLQAAVFSILPEPYHNISHKTLSIASLSRLVQWFVSIFSTDTILDPGYGNLEMTLVSRLSNRSVRSVEEIVYLFIALLRMLGLGTRLVMSLQPASHRAPDLKLKPKEISEDQPSTSTKAKKTETKMPSKASAKFKHKRSSVPGQSKHKKSCNRKSRRISLAKPSGSHGDSDHVSPYFSEESEPKQKGKKQVNTKDEEVPAVKGKGLGKGNSRSKVVQKHTEIKGSNIRRRRRSKVDSYCELSEGSDGGNGEKNEQEVRKTGSKQRRSHHGNQKHVNKCQGDSESSDEDFEVDNTKYRSPTAHTNPGKLTKSCQSSSKSKVVKILSSDSESDCYEDKGIDHWLEVYLSTEKKWICVECSQGLVDVTEKMETMTTQPLQYVVAFNADGSCKDITRKYAQNFMCDTHKLRVVDEWWTDTMECFKGAESAIDRQEDALIKSHMMKQPIPSSVSQLKSHPLYALKRHLLKFEAIYPSDAPPLGFVRGEPVYARECVHTLHSRENWLKEARVVRLNEEAYKWVKARPKRRQKLEDKPTLPLYGYWQTEDYIPPPAVNGKVPRNEYGNVELFKPSMLPGGTVHLQVPGLNRVAKKLGLDCVAAMVGWDHHSGYAHPILDGWIVCEEHKDTLLSAWDEQQEIDKEKEAEKREKRVLENWRKLVRGLVIKERLKRKYNLVDSKDTDVKSAKAKETGNSVGTSEKTVARETAMAWPMNRQQEKEEQSVGKKTSKKEEGPLFPFEMKVETM